MQFNDFSDLVSDLNLAQHDLWLTEHGARPHLFFDTADVRRALLGANEYISWQGSAASMAVNVAEFDKPQVLVDCLIAAMLLGPFSMLPPHQAELLRQLRDNNAFERVPKKLDQTSFLRQIGIDSRWGTDDTDEEVLRETLEAHAGEKTERFFKAVQCIGMPWWDQLRKLTQKNMFVEGVERFDYPTLLKRKELPRLLSAFKNNRPKNNRPNIADDMITRNDFADAMSLLMMIDLTRRFKKGESKIVPRFFDSSGLFGLAASEAEVAAELMIVSDRLKSSVLVSAKELICATSLKCSREEPAPFLAKLKEAVAGLDQASDDSQRFDELARNLIPFLGPQLQQFLDLSFLEGVWLRTAALDELRDIRKRWVADSAFTDQFRGVIDQTVGASLKGVLNGASEYRIVSNAWAGLRLEVVAWRKKQLERRSRTAEFQLDVGMFRFGARPEMIDCVRRSLEAFVDDQVEDEDITKLREWHELLACCIDLEVRRETRPNKDGLSSTEFVAGALWALDAHSKLIEFLRSHIASTCPFIVRVIYFAAMLRLGRDLRKVENGIEDLCHKVEELKSLSEARGQVLEDLMIQSSSAAYLWFRLWRARYIDPPQWRRGSGSGGQQHGPGTTSRYLGAAIEYVDLAYDCAQEISSAEDYWRERQIYVANQRLCYLVERGDESRITDMDAAYDKLEGYQQAAKGLWQPTYSDTLARYWAFRAHHASDARTWTQFMDEANRHFKQAFSADDPEVKSFGAYLMRTEAAGFQPRSMLLA
jgi:hypothetical protein